jgi:hypothetical protein
VTCLADGEGPGKLRPSGTVEEFGGPTRDLELRK